MTEKIQCVIERISKEAHLLDNKLITLGFDGFIDCIVKVIRNKNGTQAPAFFDEIRELGDYLLGKQGMSCSLELKELTTKIGGNMPILANSISRLGVNVNCIGALGMPEIKPVFRKMPEKCRLYSIAEPGQTIAMEFNDGKVMLAQLDSVNHIRWQDVKDILGVDTLISFFTKSDCIGILNWSELDCSTAIWEGIIEDILPYHTPSKEQILFFDLSDCSKRSPDEIQQALKLIEVFARHYKAVLSLNVNEAILVAKALGISGEQENIGLLGRKIYDGLAIDLLSIHDSRCAYAWSAAEAYSADTLFIEIPELSTGGGDNFNAGLCVGLMMGVDVELSLILANSVSGFYVKNGYSPDINQLLGFLEDYKTIFLQKVQ